MGLTRKNKIIFVITAIVLFTMYKCFIAYTTTVHANDIDDINFSAELFMAENGFEKARDYANSIFGELFCVDMGLVYEDALDIYDLQSRYLSVAIFTSSETQNHLYLYYCIPEKNSNKIFCTTLEMEDISRDGAGVYHCTDINIYTDSSDAYEILTDTLEINASKLELDSVVRREIDYGILYNRNPDFYEEVFEVEKDRLTEYLLSVQEERMGDYSFSTNPEINGVENVGSYIIDIEKYFDTQVPDTDDNELSDINSQISEAGSVSDNAVAQDDNESTKKDTGKAVSDNTVSTNSVSVNTVSENEIEESVSVNEIEQDDENEDSDSDSVDSPTSNNAKVDNKEG